LEEGGKKETGGKKKVGKGPEKRNLEKNKRGNLPEKKKPLSVKRTTRQE